MNIGQRLYELRAAKDLSQGDIEKRTGLLRCYISRVENGHTVPSLETLEKMAHGLEVKLYELFFEGEGKPQAIALGTRSPLDPEERRLFDALEKLDDKGKRTVIGLAQKMASRHSGGKRARRRS